jgi:hypothetical protein
MYYALVGHYVGITSRDGMSQFLASFQGPDAPWGVSGTAYLFFRKSFLDDFAMTEAYQERRDLTNYMRLGGESLQMYLYVCALRFGTATFPVFYIPAAVTLDERNGDLLVEFDPHRFIHKRAIDYLVQELGSSAARLALSPIDNRLIYLDPQKSYIDEIDRVLIKMSAAFDYVGSKSKLEQLHTARMTHELDRCCVEFVEKSRTTARTLGGVIKTKQRFPQDAFEGLKEAFPCIIAGIRKFAEYVPLKRAIFDVVAIDEASQVSVAQAFPALLRAKKVVVLSDQKQFSNVKAANASIALTPGYLTDLDQYFRAHISNAADKILRLKQFDVKKSVLEFFELIANHTDMLRKHFRRSQVHRRAAMGNDRRGGGGHRRHHHPVLGAAAVSDQADLR